MQPIEEKIPVMEKVTVNVDKYTVTAKGERGELSRVFFHPRIKIDAKENNVVLTSKKPTKREKMMVGTFKSHIKNMMKGASEGFTYKLKVCSSHFPMTVAVENNFFVVKNFLGEKIPRKARIIEGVDVKINGDILEVTGTDKEKVGQTAAVIEKTTKRKGFDLRRFQDGIYMIEKAGKEI